MPDLDQTLTSQERDALDFALGTRRRWAHTMFPALRAEWEAAGFTADDHLVAREQVHQLALYPWFSQMERYQQKILWRTVGDIVAARRDELSLAVPSEPGDSGASLVIPENLELPSWYADIDIHVQPGGVWSDELCAHVYELGARIVMLRGNDGYGFHNAFVNTAMHDQPVERIVDFGSGFGKSTWPLAEKWPEAEVISIELSEPCTRLAYEHAVEKGLSITCVQGNVVDTGLADNSVDIVTGTMLLHEMPTEIIEATLAEAVRILKPGGILRFLEFCPKNDPVFDAITYEHGDRNNEPFFYDLFDADTLGHLRDLGMVDTAWVPFDERGGGVSPAGWGERAEWHFPWAVLWADKPAVDAATPAADSTMEAVS
ncbi:MAG: class I SAM-dependent methyltransferase [Actinobacteria bacterium]|nr:class I SAM-dependent methyltransferase [Actinomycetota bacterium]